jgi:hypothetical protein
MFWHPGEPKADGTRRHFSMVVGFETEEDVWPPKPKPSSRCKYIVLIVNERTMAPIDDRSRVHVKARARLSGQKRMPILDLLIQISHNEVI